MKQLHPGMPIKCNNVCNIEICVNTDPDWYPSTPLAMNFHILNKLVINELLEVHT